MNNERQRNRILRLVSDTFQKAVRTGNLCYLHADWSISSDYRDGWLFRAYPGGRRELSRRGAELVGAIKAGQDD